TRVSAIGRTRRESSIIRTKGARRSTSSRERLPEIFDLTGVAVNTAGEAGAGSRWTLRTMSFSDSDSDFLLVTSTNWGFLSNWSWTTTSSASGALLSMTSLVFIVTYN